MFWHRSGCGLHGGGNFQPEGQTSNMAQRAEGVDMKGVIFGRLCVAAVALGLVGFCGSARATIDLYNNLNASASYLSGADSVDTNIFGPLADSFSTGSDPFVLQDVKVLLSLDSALLPSPSGSEITVSLRSDSSTSPGDLLYVLGTFSDTGDLIKLQPGEALNVPVPSYTLAANTRYWIEVSGSPTAAQWSWSTDISGTGVANEYYSNYAFGHLTVSQNSGGPYQMEVSGVSAVPEPATILTWSLLGSFALGLGWWGKQKSA